MVELSEVRQAAERIAGVVRRTPVVAVDPPSLALEAPAAGSAPGWELLLKLEFLQHSGSFKARGATNRVLSLAESGRLPAAGVIAASGGNAGLAVAWAARRIGVPAEIVVPRTAPAVKVAGLRALGADVRQHGTQYAEAHEFALGRAEATGAAYCHAYDQPEMVAGQGTLGLELADQAEGAGGGAVDTVLVAVGGGGLIGGIGVALAGTSRLVAVEPVTAPTLHAALAAGGPVDVEVSGLAADALGARRLGTIAYDVLTRVGVESLLVPDAAIAAARRLLWERLRIVVEPAAATALAALTSGGYRPAPGERVAVVLCGANTDPSDLLAAPAPVSPPAGSPGP